MPSSSTKPGHTRQKPSTASRPSLNRQKTEVIINIYDLLPPGRLATTLWHLGGSLLHSGVAINGREYAYGGHNKRGVTGVYWTKPRFEPPGGTFRSEILQGFTFSTEQELDAIIKEVSERFLGTSYNLLTNNCNHFTSALCERLTAKPAPGWLNRAASIGLALPCMVPREWISPPDHETAEGELCEDVADDDEAGDDDDERSAMLESDRRRERKESEEQRQRSSFTSESNDGSEMGNSLAGGKRILPGDQTPPPRLVSVKDTSGREIPVAERAPIPKKT